MSLVPGTCLRNKVNLMGMMHCYEMCWHVDWFWEGDLDQKKFGLHSVIVTNV